MSNVFFNEYQKCISTSEKLDFLYRYLSLTDQNTTGIIVYLIALENNNFEIDELDKELKIVKSCGACMVDDFIWRYIVQGIAYLKLGKFNLELCEKSRDSFESFYKESRFHVKPSYYLFYMGHVLYEIGSLHSNKEHSIDMFKQSLDCFGEILEKHQGLGNSYYAMVHNMMGNIKMKLENLTQTEKTYEESETLYNQSIMLCDNFAFPYTGLGNIYRERRNYYLAIRNYVASLEIDPDLMYPWNYLGDCFRILEKYNVAHLCYQKAFELSKDIRIIYPLYGLGRIYYELGNRKNNNEKYYEKAIDYFIRTKEIAKLYTPQIRFALKDLAQVYQKLGRYQEALDVYDEIIAHNVFSKQENYIEFIQNSKEQCKANKSISDRCHLTSEDFDPLHILMCSIFEQGLEKRINDKKESFSVNFLRWEKMSALDFQLVKKECKRNDILNSFINQSESHKNDCYFQILRRWNSYTPTISYGKGGGYFLRVDDVGIAIDPGFNFIKNFKDAKHSFSEIDVILITHSHDDHTADLEAILSLQRRYNKNLERKVIPRELAKELRITTKELLENESLKPVAKANYAASKKRLVLYASECVKSKFQGIFSDKVKMFGDQSYAEILNNVDTDHDIFLKVVNSEHECITINQHISFYPIKANHEDLILKQPCLGYVVEVAENVIVFTGDTGWYNKDTKESLEEQYTEIRKRHQSQNIILVAHLGGFHECENKYWRYDSMQEMGADMFYPDHLGRIGMVKLIEALNPDLCLISEFGEEFNGTRIKIAEIFQHAFSHGYKTKFLPADIGLQIDLYNSTSSKERKDLKIKAISLIDYKNKSIVYESVGLNDVAVGEFKDTNSLFFYKKNSNVIESDCIQAFLDGYNDNSEVSLSF